MVSTFRTTALTVGVIYVIVAAIAVVAIDLRIVLIPAACASLGLTVGGLVVFRRLSGALALPVPAREDHAELQGSIIIEGTPLTFQGYDQELIVAVRVQHLVELLTCTALAGLALYLMVFSPLIGRSNSELEIGGYEAELICGTGLAVLLVSLRWFQERWRLRSGSYAIGYLLAVDPGFLRRGITYQFFAPPGERRGGHGPPWGRPNDNAVLVLYDPKNPDTNVAHGGFVFHRFALALIPSRNRQQNSPTNVQADYF
jgi:hypothetical protein